MGSGLITTAVVVRGRDERLAGVPWGDCHVEERMGVALGLEGRLEKVAVRGTKVCGCCPRDWEIESSTLGDCATTVETTSSSNKTPTRNRCDIGINDGMMGDIYVTMTDRQVDSSLDLQKKTYLGPCFHLGPSERKSLPRIDAFWGR